MFEDSLFASSVSVEQRRSARRRRWFALASVGVQGLVLAGFVAVPLIWPETLPLVSVAPKIAVLLRKPEVKVEPKPVPVVTTHDLTLHAPAPTVEQTRGAMITRGTATVDAAEHVGISLYTSDTMGGPASLSSLFSGGGSGKSPNIVTATAKKPETLNISRGVMAGRLIEPIRPVYPRLAIAVGVQGTVVVTATIDKTGRIVGAQVLSGPEMLRNAALDAMKDARYRPYLLNGEPTEVSTTISVNFRIGG